LQNNKGFTLVETVVSLLLLSIIVLAFFNNYLSVNKMNKLAERKRLSFQLCQEVLTQIDQGNINIKQGKYEYNKIGLSKLMINSPDDYAYIDKITIKTEPLFIQGKLIERIFKIYLNVQWRDHSFSIETLVKGGEDDIKEQ